MNFDRKFLLCALAYAVFGICLGIYMAASKNHSEFVAHAHILLIGFVLSFIYSLIHKLWIKAPSRPIGTLQFYLHQASALVISIGLLLLYAGRFQEALDPILGASALGVLLAALLMIYLVLRYPIERARELAH
jgi:hypothetical protein